jgi:hypothetical protein
VEGAVSGVDKSLKQQTILSIVRSLKKYPGGGYVGSGKDTKYLLAQLSNASASGKEKSSKDIVRGAMEQRYSADKKTLPKHQFDSLVRQQTEKIVNMKKGGYVKRGR